MNFEWLFSMQIVMVILMIFLIRKLNQMKKQVDFIIKEVSQYISFIAEDMKEEVEFVEKEAQKEREKSQDEAQNRLIQAVLGEYFP